MKIRRVPISENRFQLQFTCPGCGTIHAISEQVHQFSGDYEKPTLHPSVLVRGWLNRDLPDGVCHSWVVDGKILFLSDCSHASAGSTMDLPEIEP